MWGKQCGYYSTMQSCILNPVNRSGHYVYHQFNIQQFHVLSTQYVYVFCVDLRTNSDYFCILYNMLCILCTVYCMLYTLYCVLYTLYCILCTVYCISVLYAVYPVLYTVYPVLCTVYFVLYTLCCIPCTVYPVLYTACCILYTLYCVLYTVYFVLYTVCCIPCTVYCVLYAVYPVLYTVCPVLCTLYCMLYTLYCILHADAVYEVCSNSIRIGIVVPVHWVRCVYSQSWHVRTCLSNSWHKLQVAAFSQLAAVCRGSNTCVYVIAIFTMCESTEQRICIKFCFEIVKTATETYQLLQQAYGEDAMGRTQVFDWFRRFKAGRTSVESDLRSVRPSTSSC